MVEFAFVAVIFAMLLFGIVNMGVLLAFKQNMTQAASESARSSVGIVDDSGTTDDERYLEVQSALDSTLDEFSKTCGAGGVACSYKVHDCSAITDDFAAISEDRNAAQACMTVRIEFDNTGTNRIMPAFPIIASLEPKTMSSQTTVRLVPVS